MVASGGATGFAAVSEYAEMNGQVLLRVFADGLDERARLNQQLVSVVIERGVLKELACAALAGIEFVGDGRELGDGVVQFVGEVFILEQLARGAAAGIQKSVEGEISGIVELA